jgi:two-component system LytT family response regulator
VRCIIVEDEPLAQQRLAGYIAQLPFLQLAKSFDSAADALSFLMTQPVDVVFLDISLGGMSGIELLEALTVTSAVILTTAHSEYALKGYDLKVADYLLKPFTFARFVQAVERAQSVRLPSEQPKPVTHFFVKSALRIERVALNELLFIEGSDDYRVIHTLSKRIKTLDTFATLEQRLPQEAVCRVHKSYMVALERIELIERDRIVICGTYIPISATYRGAFYARIGHGIA